LLKKNTGQDLWIGGHNSKGGLEIYVDSSYNKNDRLLNQRINLLLFELAKQSQKNDSNLTDLLTFSKVNNKCI